MFAYSANQTDSDSENVFVLFFFFLFSCSFLLQLLWNYKLNLTTDPKFESVATEVCKSTITEVSLHRRRLRVQLPVKSSEAVSLKCCQTSFKQRSGRLGTDLHDRLD